MTPQTDAKPLLKPARPDRYPTRRPQKPFRFTDWASI